MNNLPANGNIAFELSLAGIFGRCFLSSQLPTFLSRSYISVYVCIINCILSLCSLSKYLSMSPEGSVIHQ
jgi:hypothetical protein